MNQKLVLAGSAIHTEQVNISLRHRGMELTMAGLSFGGSLADDSSES